MHVPALRTDAGGDNPGHERPRGAVEDRDLRAVDIDDSVADPASGERGHQVLGRAHLDAGEVHQPGAELGRTHRVPERRHHRVGPGHVGPAEPDAVPGRGGADGHAGGAAGVETGTGEGGRARDGRLHVIPSGPSGAGPVTGRSP